MRALNSNAVLRLACVRRDSAQKRRREQDELRMGYLERKHQVLGLLEDEILAMRVVRLKNSTSKSARDNGFQNFLTFHVSSGY